MNKIAFLGDRKSLLMYSTAGFTLFSPDSEIAVKKYIEQLKHENYAIILVSEYVYEMAADVISEYDNSFLPAIIVIPGYGEMNQVGINRMNGLIEKAVGIKF